MCWGSNSYGKLGIGNDTVAHSLYPAPVVGLSSGVAAIGTGSDHACALRSSAGVVCWGANDDGQLGNNTLTDSTSPVVTTGLASGVVTVRAGGSHSCAILSGGRLVCWGANGSGQLGDNSTTDALSPVGVHCFE